MPFLHIERYESIAHCGELLSATRGVLFVLKTPFFAKKIQKHEILPCNKVKSFFVCKFTFSLLGYCILCGVLAELCKDAALFFIVFCHIE